jgi:hypothetical protein
MSAPCVIGQLLSDAEAMLEAVGLRVAHVSETRSPIAVPSGPLRVVRQREVRNGIELVAAASVVLEQRENGHE